MQNQSSENNNHEFNLLQFLFPEKLLEQLNAQDNPLLTYTKRHNKRWFRRAIIFLMDLFLIFIIYELLYLLTNEYSKIFNSFIPSVFYHTFYQVMDEDIYKLMIVLFTSTIILLHHQFLNDHSGHIKKLTHENLSHLLQTPLNQDDYFLHHLLTFCHKFRIIILFGLAVALRFIVSLLSPEEFGWIQYEIYYTSVFTVFALVILNWSAATLQYVIEWRMFAGGIRSNWYRIFSRLFSLFLATLIGLYCLMVYSLEKPTIVLICSAILFYGITKIAHDLGLKTRKEAMTIIKERFAGKDTDIIKGERYSLLPGLKLLNPWHWFHPDSETQKLKQQLNFPFSLNWKEEILYLPFTLIIYFSAFYFSYSLIIIKIQSVSEKEFYFTSIACTLTFILSYIFSHCLLFKKNFGQIKNPFSLIASAFPFCGIFIFISFNISTVSFYISIIQILIHDSMNLSMILQYTFGFIVDACMSIVSGYLFWMLNVTLILFIYYLKNQNRWKINRIILSILIGISVTCIYLIFYIFTLLVLNQFTDFLIIQLFQFELTIITPSITLFLVYGFGYILPIFIIYNISYNLCIFFLKRIL